MPMDALEVGIPKLCGELATDGGVARPRHHDHRHDGEGSRSRLSAPQSAGWRRVRRCCHRPWRRCSLSSTDAASITRPCNALAAVGETFTSVGRRMPFHQRHRARARQRTGGPGRPTRLPARSPGLRLARGVMARCRRRDEVRSGRSWRRAPAARSGSASSANSQLVQCSLNGNDPYWGSRVSGSAPAAYLDPELVDISYKRRRVPRRRRVRARRRHLRTSPPTSGYLRSPTGAGTWCSPPTCLTPSTEPAS